MKKIFFLFFITLLLFSFSDITFWFDINKLPKDHTYVFDEADIFSQDEENKLSKQLKNIEDQTTSEILVMSIKSLENQDISQLWVKIWEHLWVWKADVDNWLVILIAPNDRQWNISTWYWLEWILPDIRTKHIWERNFPQYFREENYYQWIHTSLNDIHWFLISDQGIISKYETKYSTNNTNNFEDNIVFIIFWSLFLSWFIYRKKEKKKIRFIKFIFLTTVTSILIYIFISLSFVFVNIIIQSILALLVDKSWNWNYSSWRWYSSRRSSSSSRSRSFGWGSFGWGGSKWKW
jgi:uncharacterized protein